MDRIIHKTYGRTIPFSLDLIVTTRGFGFAKNKYPEIMKKKGTAIPPQ
jgi:hypothetical protein